MPFKSEAQRRFFYHAAKHGKGGITPEMAEEWQAHTPKGKKLPEKVAMENAFFDEFEKISAESKPKGLLHRVGNWVGEHPLATAAIGTGVGAGSVLGRRLLARAAPAASESVRTMQNLARSGGVHFKAPTNLRMNEVPSVMERAKAFVQSRGMSPVLVSRNEQVLPEYARRAQKGLTVGLHPDAAAGAPADLRLFSQDPESRKRLIRDIVSLKAGGKPAEMSEEVGLSHAFPRGGSLEGIAAKHGVPLPEGMPGSVEQQVEHLKRVQEAMKAEFGAPGFVMKPSGMQASSGAFPSHKGDWGELWRDYSQRLRPQITALRADIARNPGKYPAKGVGNIVAEKFRSDPAYAGTALEAAFKRPDLTLGQEMMNIVKTKGGVPAEYRVHMVGGEVPEELSYDRYNMLRNAFRRVPFLNKMKAKEFGTQAEAAKWVRENVSPHISKELKEGTFALDVARVKAPDGGYAYKLVELNPSGPESMSGFMMPSNNPLIADDVSRWLTGKDAPLTTAAKATGAGAAVGGAGLAASRALKERE